MGPSKQDTQIGELRKLIEAKDSELLGLNARINEMLNQIKSKYPSLYQAQQPDSTNAIAKLESLFKYLQNASNNSQNP